MSSLLQKLGTKTHLTRFLQRLPHQVDEHANRSLGGSGSKIADTNQELQLYHRLRSAGREVHNRLLKVVNPERMFAAARSLGLMKGQKIVFHDESQMSVLQDFLYYTVRHDGETLIAEHARQSSLHWSEDEQAFLEAGAQSRFCIVLAEKMFPGLGFDFVDLLTGQQGFLIDINMSLTSTEGAVMVTHVIPVPGTGSWSMTGASLPLTSDQVSRLIFESVKKLDAKYSSLDQLPTDEQVQLETFVIRTCLNHPTAIRYADAGEAASWTNRLPTTNSSSVTRVGRNEFCPCGSGKKFKRCCGPTAQ